jgi:ubiquinone/menaquinone biosynthesis C-methylase UbiE
MNGKEMKQEEVTPERIMRFVSGYSGPLIIETALELGIFDLLHKEPKTAAELASATGASLRGIRSMANALVGLELLIPQGQQYSLSPDAAVFLVSHKPSFHGALFRHSVQSLLPRWINLREVVRSGKPIKGVNSEKEGAAWFAEFVEALFPLNYAAARALAEHLQLKESKAALTVLDLAAGSGVWGIVLAQASPHVKIRAVDWPEVLKVTERVAEKHGVANRLTLAPGDLLEADFGQNNAVATLGHILHSEGVERSKKLLRKTFEALAPGGTIAIMDFLANEDRTGPPQALIFSVNMLVNTDQGDTYTFGEISGWLKEAGFENARMLEVPAVSPLILANRPK